MPLCHSIPNLKLKGSMGLCLHTITSLISKFRTTIISLINLEDLKGDNKDLVLLCPLAPWLEEIFEGDFADTYTEKNLFKNL